MKKITRNLNAMWLLTLLLSAVSVQGMELEHNDQLRDIQSKIKALEEPTQAECLGLASLSGIVLLATESAVPMLSVFLLGAYGLAHISHAKQIELIKAYNQQESRKEREQQAAEQRECFICCEGPENGISIMNIPCAEIHPDRICVGCYQGIMKKNALCPSCHRELRSDINI